MKNQVGMTTKRRKKTISNIKVGNMLYNDLCNMYITQCSLKNLSPTTIKGYKFAHKKFMNWVDNEQLMCHEITQDLINEYILCLKETLKPETVNSYQFKVSPIIKFGMDRGFITDNIIFTHMIEQEKIKAIYTNEELEKLLKKPEGNSFAEYRTWVIINLLLATGVRALELRELTIKDVDIDNGIISLQHTKNNKPRLLPIPSSLSLTLFEYLNVRNGTLEEPLFCNIYGEALPRTTLQLSVSKYCKKRGVEKTSLHLFRHTFITLSVKKGMSPLLLRRITGHSNFKILDNYYQFNPTDIVEVVDIYNPLEDFKKKKKIVLKGQSKKK